MVDALVRGRQRLGGAVMDGLVMEALYSLTSTTTFRQFAEAVLHADTVKYAGVHADGLRLDFGTWQILTPGLDVAEMESRDRNQSIVIRSGAWPLPDQTELWVYDVLGRSTLLQRDGVLPSGGWYTAEGPLRVLVIP
jgi:hypothetical protein